MEKFNRLEGVAAYLPLLNIDTDMIIPKQFLKTIRRTGLGKNLFFEMRYDNDGKERADFVLNREPFRNAKILLAGSNFGCGSSREHAPWALLDFGIRCVIAPSFADIFFNNCFKNGVLPLVLAQDKIEKLARSTRITVDLEKQEVSGSDGFSASFEVDSFRRHCLLNGLDDIGLTLQKIDTITAFETKRTIQQPWI